MNRFVRAVSHVLQYLKNRFNERSTWLAIGVGITGAAALPDPWSYAFASVGVIGAIVPSRGGAE